MPMLKLTRFKPRKLKKDKTFYHRQQFKKLKGRGGAGGAITRYFAQLDPVQQSRLVYANTLVFGAGDTFEVDFLAPTSTVSSTETVVDGDTATNRLRLQFVSNGTYRFPDPSKALLEVDGVLITTPSLYPTDGKMHTAKFFVLSEAFVKYLGARYTIASFYSGIIANAVATIGGVTTTNPIGLSTSGTEFPDENVFGANLWDALGDYNSTGAEGLFATTQQELNAAVIGESYAYEITVTGITTGNFRARLGTTTDTVRLEANTTYTGVVTSNTPTIKNLVGNVQPNAGVTISTKMRLITNALEYVNIPNANIEEFQLSVDTTRWDNISALPQELPATIEIA